MLQQYIFFPEEEAEGESGMEYLVKKDGGTDGADSDPDQELTSAAATAESLQPKGFTLETAHVSSILERIT